MTCKDQSCASSGDARRRNRSSIQSAPSSTNSCEDGSSGFDAVASVAKYKRRKSKESQTSGLLARHNPIGPDEWGIFRRADHDDDIALSSTTVSQTAGLVRRRTWNEGTDLHSDFHYDSDSFDEEKIDFLLSAHSQNAKAVLTDQRRTSVSTSSSTSNKSILGHAAKFSYRCSFVWLIVLVAVLTVHQFSADIFRYDQYTHSGAGIRGTEATERNSNKHKRLLSTTGLVSTTAGSKSSSQHRLVGIVLDASAIESNILDFLVDIACNHNIMSHILASRGTSSANANVRERIEEKLNSSLKGKTSHRGSYSCAEIVFATEPLQLISGIDNRVDRIARLRDYQRDMLMTDRRQLSTGTTGSNDGGDVVIVADLDLHMLPSVEEVMEEIEHTVNSDAKGTGIDIVCAAGIMHRPFGYYDTFA